MTVWGGVKRFAAAVGGVISGAVGLAFAGAGIFINAITFPVWVMVGAPWAPASVGFALSKGPFNLAGEAFNYTWNGEEQPTAHSSVPKKTMPPAPAAAKAPGGVLSGMSNPPSGKVSAPPAPLHQRESIPIIAQGNVKDLLDNYSNFRKDKKYVDNIPAAKINKDNSVEMYFNKKEELGEFCRTMAASGKSFVVKNKEGMVMAYSDGKNLYNPNTQTPYGANDILKPVSKENEAAALAAILKAKTANSAAPLPAAAAASAPAAAVASAPAAASVPAAERISITVEGAGMHTVLSMYNEYNNKHFNPKTSNGTLNNNSLQLHFNTNKDAMFFFKRFISIKTPYVVKDGNSEIMAYSSNGTLYNPNTRKAYGVDDLLQPVSQKNKLMAQTAILMAQLPKLQAATPPLAPPAAAVKLSTPPPSPPIDDDGSAPRIN